jgi:hypothetical protein
MQRVKTQSLMEIFLSINVNLLAPRQTVLMVLIVGFWHLVEVALIQRKHLPLGLHLSQVMKVSILRSY